MPYLLLVLWKINLVLLLFAAAYYLVLRRLTFYSANRWFLLFGVLFSSAYPFIDLSVFFEKRREVIYFIPDVNARVSGLAHQAVSGYWQFILLVFYAGALLMAVRLAIQFISLYRIHRRSVPGRVADYRVRILRDALRPFSFWQSIYIHPALYREEELQTILAHEDIHIKGWHSIDILLAEWSVVFYWFNPGVWLMKKAVKENLEFITDDKILKKGVDRKTYQYSLLETGSLHAAPALVNHFNFSDLKTRIKRMNARRSSRLHLGRYVIVIPLLLLTLAFTVSKKATETAAQVKKTSAIRQLLPVDTLIKAPLSSGRTLKEPVKAPRKGHRLPEKTSMLPKLTEGKHIAIIVDSLRGAASQSGLAGMQIVAGEAGPKADLAKVLSKVQGIKITRLNEAPLSEPEGPADKKKVITVVGFKAETAPQTPNKTLVLKGLPANAITADKRPVLYVNGQRMNEKILSSLLPEEVTGIDIRPEGSHGEIHIRTVSGQPVRPPEEAKN